MMKNILGLIAGILDMPLEHYSGIRARFSFQFATGERLLQILNNAERKVDRYTPKLGRRKRMIKAKAAMRSATNDFRNIFGYQGWV